ncbi:MAG: glycosyltransferase, partial [Pyrinomonadaceae bacterium]
NMTGASNKPFDYLACGLPLLVSDLPDWRNFFVEPGYALACDMENPQSIADAVRWYLDHPEEMRRMGEGGRQRIISEWNYEKQFSPILEKLSR